MPDKTEPKDSASSSGDEGCARCGHLPAMHDLAGCLACPGGWRGGHAFIPAPPLCEGCPDPKHGDDPCEAEGCLCQHPVPCPEEPECSACGGDDPDSCPFCADRVARGHRIEVIRQSLSSYAVAYATGSGAVIELALPADASAAVVNGALVIRHPSGVLGIQHVKPCGGAE